MVHLLLAVIYISFISLGLPDSLLGSAWPSMYVEFGVPVSYAGVISMIISAGTIVSSLQSDRLTRKFGAGLVTAVSVGMTAAALFGFSLSHSFWMLCLWAIPYGLGAGSVDAALNNYVALHYASRHMSWLHCMWGVGASAGPTIISWAMMGGEAWNAGYRTIALLQVGLTAILLLSLPLWQGRGNAAADNSGAPAKPLTLRQIFAIPGAKAIFITFFCYCALEQTSILWASSYFALYKGIPAAGYASLFCIGITAGRAVSGFLTMKLSDEQMIRLGQGIIAASLVLTLLPGGHGLTVAGLVLAGLGCAPIYPCVIHSTPAHFGAERSQAVIGVQMASAYTGACLMPPVFGLIANHIHIGLFPVFLLVVLVCMFLSHETLLRQTHTAPKV